MALASFALLLVAELVARAAEPGPFRWYDISPYEKVTNLPHVHRRNARVHWDGSSRPSGRGRCGDARGVGW